MKLLKNILLIAALCVFRSANAKVADLIMLLDPAKSETIEKGLSSLAVQASVALQEKAAPIILSSNILEIILNVQAKLGNDNLQQLRTIIQTSSDIASMRSFLFRLKIYEKQNDIALISLINFDNKNFNCYLHKSANLVLIIPKQYIQTNFPNATNLNINDQAQACGFNPASLIAINSFSAEDLLQKLQQSAHINTEKFIPQLTALFSPNKQDLQWAIYLIGHGGPAQSAQGTREQLIQAKEKLSFQQGFASQSDISSTEANIKRYEQILATGNNGKIIPTSARVTGVSLQDFSELLEFFDKKINVAFLHYTTCFGGGYNQIFVNEILSSLKTNFIVSSQGLAEKTTTAIFPQLIPNSSRSGLVPDKQPYTDFFKLLNLFIDKPEEFVRTKGEKKEPIAQILHAIIPTINKDDQPFVRFPGIGTFEALSLNKNIKILTQAIVRAHEIEKRPIDISNTDINVVIIKPSRINVLLNLGNKDAGHPVLVFPTPKNVPSVHETIHVFKEINFGNTLRSLLFNFIHLNARRDTQTFVIKKLTGITANQGTSNTINNLIIQIKGILGTSLEEPFLPSTPLTAKDIKSDTIGANVEIAFELNGNIYQGIVGITNFGSSLLQNNLAAFNFTSKPMATMDMNSFANKFLTSQEVSKLHQPITLESIAQCIDSKINQQEPSLFNQSDIDNEALRKFLERK